MSVFRVKRFPNAAVDGGQEDVSDLSMTDDAGAFNHRIINQVCVFPPPMAFDVAETAHEGTSHGEATQAREG